MIEVVGDRWDIFCVRSRERVLLCACANCEPLRRLRWPPYFTNRARQG